MSAVGRPVTCVCGVCRKCKQRIYMRQWWGRQSEERRSEIVAARDQTKVAATKAAHAPDWRRRNPEKVRAHKAVGRALRAGTLTRMPCEVCGSTGRIEAHHDDYSKPLEVRWLCPKHHRAAHVAGGGV